MLWYKSWLDTRWRFLIGLAVVLFAACGVVMTYSDVRDLLPTLGASPLEGAGPFRDAIAESLELARTYRGFIWRQWFDQNFTYLALAFAVFLGSGNALAGSGSGVVFSLALPVSRGQWIGARAATGLTELLVLTIIPSIAIVPLSLFVGESLSVGDAFVHGACLFVVAAVFFSIALLLSTVFNDLWRPLLLTYLVAMCLAFVEQTLLVGNGLFAVMSGESYFRSDSLPWSGLALSAVLTAALLYAAAARVARRDY